MASRRFAEPAVVPGHRAARSAAGTLDGTVSRTRRRIDLETHQAVFTWVLQRLADAGLVRGTTVGIDETTLEANAALPSIVRRGTQDYEPFLRGLAEASGMSTPTRAELPASTGSARRRGPTTSGRICRTRTRRSPA